MEQNNSKMWFTEGDLFHVYNRGNNSQKEFFTRDNYFFFIEKIKEFILPHANILAWCLLPNHFHLMVEVLHEELPVDTHRVTWSHPVSKKLRSLNDSIAIMLRSYTRAINIQEKRTGALFQQGTKSICLNTHELSPAYYDTSFGIVGNCPFPEMEYPGICFHYIHQNPLRFGLVTKPEDWEFSSFRDYFLNRKDGFVNKESAAKFAIYSPGDLESPGE